MIHCFVCYPMAGMFNHISAVFVMGIFLALNNICYVALGGALGLVFESIPLSMSLSTIVSQSTLVAAGFYNRLPLAVSWIRYISPVFWTYRGILKTMFHWTDTYSCVKGQSDVGSNQCYLEFNPGIDALKTRGINVASFNTSQSDGVFIEVGMLCLLFLALQIMIFLTIVMSMKKTKSTSETDISPRFESPEMSQNHELSLLARESLRRSSILSSKQIDSLIGSVRTNLQVTS